MSTTQLRKWSGKITQHKIRKNYFYAGIRFPANELADKVGKEIIIQELPDGFLVKYADAVNDSELLQQSTGAELLNQRLKDIENTICGLDESVSEIKDCLISNIQKNSGLVEIRTQDLRRVKNGNLLDLFKQYKAQFTDYLEHVRKVSEARKKDYINGILKLPNIKNVGDLLKLKLTDSQTKGLRVFVHFLEDVIGLERILNIIPDKWLKNLKVKQRQPKITFINDTELEEAFPLIPVNLQTYFKLATFTGARGVHLFRALQDFRPENIQTDGDNPEVSFYAVTDAGRGNKNSFVLYFPSSFVDELKDYKLPYEHPSSILKALQDAGMPVKNLRKWHANLLLKCGIQESIVDYLQSRTSRSVIAKHYINLHAQACRSYAAIIPHFPELTG